MIRRWLTAYTALPLLLCAAAPLAAQQNSVPSPADVLGYGIGERFTDVAGITRYLEAVTAAAPDRTRLERYGQTPEGRPLVQLVIARADLMARLDQVLAMNRELSEPATSAARARQIAAENPAVLYFSYGVHGNESSSSEAALYTIWDLLRDAPEVAHVLDSAVVVIDPVVNPDGRDRYVHGYKRARGAEPNPDPSAREHSEPWPGGRTNHYMFDLNRDWAWGSQPETKARLATWDRFWPQVHVDFHEMGSSSTYFFFPAAEPINPMYPEHILEWGRIFGAANAAAFDRHGWDYYTAEGFDLFYPGYGDTWPSLLGAIGMTYEQAGGGSAGLAVARAQGDTLTLTDRAEHHRTAGNATLQASAVRKSALLEGFAEFHRTSGQGMPDVLIVPGADPARARALLAHLRQQGIRYERAGSAFRTDASSYAGWAARRDFPEGTIRVPAEQPRGRLAMTLLQPDILFEGTSSYDITAWSLPFAYGVETHGADAVPDADWRAIGPTGVAVGQVVEATPPAAAPAALGWLFPPSFENWGRVVRFLTAGGHGRVLDEPFTMAGRAWPAGTFYIPARQPEARERLSAAGLGGIAVPIASGRAEEGNDLGTNDAYRITLPEVALLVGEGVSSGSAGAHWFFLEQTLGLPFDQVEPGSVSARLLQDYDVVVAPEGSRLSEGATEALTEWVRAGGTLVAVGSSARGLGASVAGLETRSDDEDEDEEVSDEERLEEALRTREERRLENWEERIPGTILPVRLDVDHPLTFGAGVDGDPGRLYVLHSGGGVFEPGTGFETVGAFGAALERVSGVISEQNLEHLSQSTWLAASGVGGGNVFLFADDPIFRHFWYAAWQPYVNAILLGPGM